VERTQRLPSEARTLAVGDRLQWGSPTIARIANGEYAPSQARRPATSEVRFDKGRKVSMAYPMPETRLGYASTSHASQAVRCSVQSSISIAPAVQFVNQRQWYVSSRGRRFGGVYTGQCAAMRRAVARTQEKELALDVVESAQQQSLACDHDLGPELCTNSHSNPTLHGDWQLVTIRCWTCHKPAVGRPRHPLRGCPNRARRISRYPSGCRVYPQSRKQARHSPVSA